MAIPTATLFGNGRYGSYLMMWATALSHRGLRKAQVILVAGTDHGLRIDRLAVRSFVGDRRIRHRLPQTTKRYDAVMRAGPTLPVRPGGTRPAGRRGDQGYDCGGFHRCGEGPRPTTTQRTTVIPTSKPRPTDLRDRKRQSVGRVPSSDPRSMTDSHPGIYETSRVETVHRPHVKPTTQRMDT